MLIKNNHTFHIVDSSPWPFLVAFATAFTMLGALDYFNYKFKILITLAYIFLILTIFSWWKNVSSEANSQGLHMKKIISGLKLGIILFIVSEILFFLSFFWAFFHFTLSPNIEVGTTWPPLRIHAFNYYEVPLLNTLILLSSGLTVTWAHKLLILNKISGLIYSLTLTVALGVYFTFLQAVEYLEASYSFYDSSYGSIFFLATGFHGLHVIIGRIFLSITLIRRVKIAFSSHRHLGFEIAAWYWHFVDVVWLFLFFSIYWWASN